MEQEKIVKKLNKDVLKKALVGLAIFVVVVLIFGAGVKIGEMKARFSYRWAENYHKNFAGPRGGFFGNWKNLASDNFIESHGAFGEIIKIDGNNLVVKGRENIEKIVLVNEKTVIKSGFKDIKISDLKVGNKIVIIGSPNEQGQIEAKFIRVFSDNDFKRPLPNS